jgi:hypothetical protein
VTAIGRHSTIVLLVAAFGVVAPTGLLAGSLAYAQSPGDGKDAPPPPAPTPEQLEQAKQAFLAGRQLFDDKKFEEAVDKFKESYRLSRNPLLLYNIAFTLDQMGQKDLAVFYYKKFVADAPADAAQRPEATARLKVLEKELAAATPPDGGGGDGGGGASGGDGGGGKKPPRRTDPSSFTADDFQHQIVEDAPPGKPLDLTAFAPEDAGWIVTLFYRGAGDAKFTAAQMKPRYNELVARVPAAKMSGVSIQYYVEVRTPDAKIVTRIGKPASPNIVYIDEKARPRYYPDLTDERDWEPDKGGGGGGGGGGGDHFVPGGWTTVGSTKFKRGKWIATGSGVGLLAVSVTFYLLAANMSSSLEAEAEISRDQDRCTPPDTIPCKSFNSDRKAIEVAGQRNELVSRVTFVLGLGAGGVAAWYWYKEIKAIKAAEKKGQASGPPVTGFKSLVAAPVVGDDFVGGTAALRF